MIVKLYLSCEIVGKENSRAQLASAKANGKLSAGYVWGYRSFDPRRTVQESVELATECGVDSPLLFLDCETYNPTGKKVEDPGPDVAWLEAAFDEYAKLGKRPAMYSGLWWLTGYLRDLAVTRGVLKWLEQYNGIPDLASVDLVDGIDRAEVCGHQFLDKPIDQSIFDGRVLRLG